jgi:hypothetical protein
MSKKRKVPATPQDCVTIEDKVAYSNMVRAAFEAIPYYAPPSALDAVMDRFPFLPECPWSHAEWSADFSRSEREKLRTTGRVKRRMLK